MKKMNSNTVIASGAGISLVGSALSMAEYQPTGVAAVALGVGAIVLGQLRALKEVQELQQYNPDIPSQEAETVS